MDRFLARETMAKQDSEMFLAVDQAQLDALADAIVKAKRIFVAGWGRAGNVVKILGMNCSQIGLTSFNVGDNTTPSIHEGDLLVIGSGSGETKTMAIIAKQAKEHGAKLGSITHSADSTITKLSDYPVTVKMAEIAEGTPAKAHGSFYHVMLLLVDVIIAYVAEEIGVGFKEIHYNHNNLE